MTRLAAANAEIERLRAELEASRAWTMQMQDARDTLGAELAAANALLKRIRSSNSLGPMMTADVDSHLAGQTAAPSCAVAEHGPGVVCLCPPEDRLAGQTAAHSEPVWDAINKRWTKTLPRTAAEQRVLDALAKARFYHPSQKPHVWRFAVPGEEGEVCEAEIARREGSSG